MISEESVLKLLNQGTRLQVEGKRELKQVIPTLKPVELPTTAFAFGAFDESMRQYQGMISGALLANPTETNIRQEQPVAPIMQQVYSESKNQTALLLKIAEARQQNIVLK